MSSTLTSSIGQRVRRMLRPGWFLIPRGIRPLSGEYGYDRGKPIDRYYIERFLVRYSADIRGHVLEVKEPLYTNRFGTSVVRSDVLDVTAENSLATIVGDLTASDGLPADSFDCFILTQTLHVIYDMAAAVRTARRVLKRNGVLLATLPSVSRINGPPGADYWRVTPAACSRLFGGVFGPEHVTIAACGNVRTCSAFLFGMAQQELSRRELEIDDPRFPLLVTVRAVKAP